MSGVDTQPSDTAATNTSVIEWTGLAPIQDQDRHGKIWHVGGLWFAAQLVPTAVFLGVIGASPGFGLSYWAAFTAIILGNVLGAIAPAALSLTGPSTGLPLLAQARAPFGKATRAVGVLAAFTSVAFIALGAIFGAQALQVAFGIEPIPAILLVFALEGVISVAGYRVMHVFERAMAFVLAAAFVVITIVVLFNLEQGPGEHVQAGAGGVGPFFLLAAISFGFSFGWSHNAPDYCRYLPASASKPRLYWAVFAGIALACTWMEVLGLTAGTLLSGTNSMGAISSLMGGGVVGAFIMVAMYLGVVANATVAQYSAGLQILGAGVRLPRPIVTAIVTVIAFALTVYLQSGDLEDRFQNVLLLATYWVAPFVGIWLVFWSRKPDHARFMATATTPLSRLPFGWPAIAALALGYLVALPFSSTAVGAELAAAGSPFGLLFGSVSRSVLDGADLAYPVGIIVGALVYAVLERNRRVTALEIP